MTNISDKNLALSYYFFEIIWSVEDMSVDT